MSIVKSIAKGIMTRAADALSMAVAMLIGNIKNIKNYEQERKIKPDTKGERGLGTIQVESICQGFTA